MTGERPLDLLFLTQTYPRFEGDTAGPFIRDLARGLVRGGDRVTVLTPARRRGGRAGLGRRRRRGASPSATRRSAARCWATAAAWRRTSG